MKGEIMSDNKCIECPIYTKPVYLIEMRRAGQRWQVCDAFYSQREMFEMLKIHRDGERKWPSRKPIEYRTRTAWTRAKK